MEPYLNFAAALMRGHDPEPELEAIRQLPVRKKVRLADHLSIEADKLTLRPEDFAKVTDLLKLRPVQMALLLKTLVGTEEMLRMMVEAIGGGKAVGRFLSRVYTVAIVTLTLQCRVQLNMSYGTYSGERLW